MDQELLWPIIERAIEEDLGQGDVTSMWALPPNAIARAHIIAQDEGILAGVQVALLTFSRVNALVALTLLKSDGEAIEPDQVVADVVGPAISVLGAERSALNFMQRMSGIATLTRRYVEAVQGTNAVILSTRKTAPGLRLIDQWAVLIGGGGIHRTRLDDMIYIRDSHIALAGSLAAALHRVHSLNTDLQVCVQVRNWEELDQALPLEPDRITLDGMSLQDMADAVKWVAGRVPLEVSGSLTAITPENVRAIAETGVDYISVGALTQCAQPVQFKLQVQ